MVIERRYDWKYWSKINVWYFQKTLHFEFHQLLSYYIMFSFSHNHLIFVFLIDVVIIQPILFSCFCNSIFLVLHILLFCKIFCHQVISTQRCSTLTECHYKKVNFDLLSTWLHCQMFLNFLFLGCLGYAMNISFSLSYLLLWFCWEWLLIS